MRLPLIALFALAIALMSGCESSSSQPSNGVGVVNFTRLVEESEVGKAAQAHMETVSGDMQQQLMALQGSADMAQMQILFNLYQEAVTALQEGVLDSFNKAVSQAAETVRVAQGYNCVLTSEMAVTYAPGADLTTAVIAELNKLEVSFPNPPFDLTPLLSTLEGGDDEAAAEDGAETPEGAAQ